MPQSEKLDTSAEQFARRLLKEAVKNVPRDQLMEGAAVNDKYNRLRATPEHLRDGDLKDFIAGQGFMTQHVDVLAVV
jgi:hypothetical protein